MSRELLEVPSVHATGGSYAHAARVGNLLFVAGQVDKNKENKFVGLGDVEAQTRHVIANLASILETAGGSLSSIVKYTTYLTDESFLEGYRRARNDCMPKPMPPARWRSFRVWRVRTHLSRSRPSPCSTNSRYLAERN